MAKSVEANITPVMLKWARESAGISIDEIAIAIDTHPLTIEEWEAGVSQPTYVQLEKISSKYKRPRMVFYLPEPPTDFAVVKDRRTTSTSGSELLSTACRFAIRDIQIKHSWASEFLDADPEKFEFIGKYSCSDDPVRVGTDLRKLLGMKIDEQTGFANPSEALRSWRVKCEAIGVLVFSFTKIDADEMRGFAISDSSPPAVATNSKDSASGRIFSLLHEMVHVLVGDSGISNRSFASLQEHEIERFCEAAAAEALIPMTDFIPRIPNKVEGQVAFLMNSLSQIYNCSRAAILFRLVDSGHLDLGTAIQLAEKIESKPTVKRKPAPIPQSTLAIGRNGKHFSKIVVSAYHSGAIHGGQLSKLLGMKVKHLPSLESKLFPSQLHTRGIA